MAYNPLSKFRQRDVVNFFTSSDIGNAGTAVTLDFTDTTLVGVGQCSYGKTLKASVSVAADTELGFYLYDVTTSGIGLFPQLAGALNYGSKAGTAVALHSPPRGSIIETDQFDATNVGFKIVAGDPVFANNTATGSLLGIKGGVWVVLQGSGAGSVARGKLIGNSTINDQNNTAIQAIRILIL